jgi:hypothetical protein
MRNLKASHRNNTLYFQREKKQINVRKHEKISHESSKQSPLLPNAGRAPIIHLMRRFYWDSMSLSAGSVVVARIPTPSSSRQAPAPSSHAMLAVDRPQTMWQASSTITSATPFGFLKARWCNNGLRYK